MALEAIGTVTQSTGEAVAVDRNGIERPLQPGDKIYAGETIKADGVNGIEIRLNDGRVIDSGGASELLLNTEIVDRIPANADVESIQAAIAAGADPTEVTEPPAAIPLEDDGFSTVRIAYAEPRGNVENGFDTTGISFNFPEARNQVTGLPLGRQSVPEPEPSPSPAPGPSPGPEDNETPPSFSIDDVTATEGVDNTITFTVTRSGNLDLVSSVRYSVGQLSDTAMAGTDFTGTMAGMLTFAAGEASKTITLNLINDGGMPEPTEQFTVNLYNPSNATIADPTGVGTILENPLDVFIQSDPDDVLGQGGIFTFVDLADPMNAYSKQFVIGYQGKDSQGNKIFLDVNFSVDPGFDVDSSANYLVAVEDASSSNAPFTGFAELTVEEVTIYSGLVSQRLSDQPDLTKPSAITSVIDPDNGISQNLTLSIDDDFGISFVNDFGGTVIHFLNGLAGNDTLNGSNSIDVLKGGGGSDSLFGNGGNDILVYDSNDAVLNGGTGIDLLRIDSSADLRNNASIKNIEGLLITDDINSDPAIGSTVQLNAQDVLNFNNSGNSLFIVGNDGDHVVLDSAFTQQGGANPQGFVSYTALVGNSQVSVTIEQSIDVTIV